METDRTRFTPLPNSRRRLWPDHDEASRRGRDVRQGRPDRDERESAAREEEAET